MHPYKQFLKTPDQALYVLQLQDQLFYLFHLVKDIHFVQVNLS